MQFEELGEGEPAPRHFLYDAGRCRCVPTDERIGEIRPVGETGVNVANRCAVGALGLHDLGFRRFDGRVMGLYVRLHSGSLCLAEARYNVRPRCEQRLLPLAGVF